MTHEPEERRMEGQETNGDEFYVGYLPWPPGHIRFLRRIVPLLLLSGVVLGGLVIRNHNNPGVGRWDSDSVETFEGVIDTVPYPMLRVAGPDPNHPVQTLLLVSEGKFGAQERVKAHLGKAVRVRGTIISRDGQRLLELAGGEDAVEPLEPTALPDGGLARPPAVSIGQLTLRGEIIDPKCYLGAMKPGEGKPHKECATLCISGGIPPMFITRRPDGSVRYYLLADSAGHAAGDGILPFVADPVEIDGIVERLADLSIFKIDPKRIRRL